MSKELKFRRFKEEDLPRISEFRKTYFPYNPSVRSCESEYYEWKCYKNPAQPGEMWLAEDGDEIVAIKNVTPKRMKVLGNVVTAAEMGDSFTHPDYQRRGIFTRLSIAARESMLDKGVSFIYNTPNKETTLPGYVKKLDHVRIPIELRSLVKPLRPQQLLQKGSPALFLAAALSLIVEVTSRAILRISKQVTTKSNVLVRPEPAFPDDIDTLWEQTSKNYDIMLVRTKDFLEWRYVTNPDTYKILIARDRDGAILGYTVTKVGFTEGVTVGFIVDVLTLPSHANIFRQLLASSMEDFYRRKVDIVSTWAVKGSSYDRVLFKLGFLPRTEVPLLCYKNELGSQILSQACKWHFTMGDSDNI